MLSSVPQCTYLALGSTVYDLRQMSFFLEPFLYFNFETLSTFECILFYFNLSKEFDAVLQLFCFAMQYSVRRVSIVTVYEQPSYTHVMSGWLFLVRRLGSSAAI